MGVMDTAILVVSFGTSNHETREKTIGGVERAIADAFPQYEVRRAFTSSFIVRKLRKEGVHIDDVRAALTRLSAEGVRNVVIQPTHLMQGNEYEKLVCCLEETSEAFENVSLGKPLLSGGADIDAVITAVTEDVKSLVVDPQILTDEKPFNSDERTAVIFMGHGSDAKANAVYVAMQERLSEKGFSDVYIATVEASPSFDEVFQMISGKDYKRVILQPLMVVAGDHALNDMAGEEDSWKSCLLDAGYEVEAILKGLGEIPAIQEIYVRHVKEALEG